MTFIRGIGCLGLWLLLARAAPALAGESVAAAESADEVALTLTPHDASGLRILGGDARVQLLATAVLARSPERHQDVTRLAEYRVEPAGIVAVDETGLLAPLADGEAVVTAVYAGQSASTRVRVEDFAGARPVSFANQIVPIFTRLGCNGGGCHGKASGQNGFRLSLLGFHPEDDYEFLVRESRGRRVFPAAPERSLLLTKPTGESPHGGGQRMDRDSPEYRILRRWIEQGLPSGGADDPAVTKIECLPDSRVMDRDAEQQVAVIATYSDGTREDVTRMALFEPNDAELASASDSGLVKTLDLSGEVAIMARYQGQVATFRATIPLGAEVGELPPAVNFIDRAVFNKLTLLGIPPSPGCDDATFLRRVSLDIAGLMPTEARVREFLADGAPDKRERLIDELLDSTAYADHFANKWNMVLRNKRRQETDQPGVYEFHQWIWDSVYENKPYDQFVREILTASGDPRSNPPVHWYREVKDVYEQVEDAAQLFLGVRVQCARCHHHPYERWSQDDYYGLAAFFSRVNRKPLDGGAIKAARDRRVVHNAGRAETENPRTGLKVRPAGLGQSPLDPPAERDPRIDLADWMADPENPFFAPALANRYWKHFFHRGLVEPEDDMRETNPPSNPELLDALATFFIESGFDSKALIREICRSSTYQRSSEPNEHNLKDKQNFSRYYPRRLSAESLYDGFLQVTAVSESFRNMPSGSRAAALPDASFAPYFLKVFGQPQGETACECERSQEATLAQSLHLLNSSDVQRKIGDGSGRIPQLLAREGATHEDRIREIYRWTFAREPDSDELRIAIDYIAAQPDDPQSGYEDIIWALVNTKEFLFNH